MPNKTMIGRINKFDFSMAVAWRLKLSCALPIARSAPFHSKLETIFKTVRSPHPFPRPSLSPITYALTLFYFSGTVVKCLNHICVHFAPFLHFICRRRRERGDAPDQNELQPLGMASVGASTEGSINEGNSGFRFTLIVF